jgi:photosystem II protein
MVVKILFSSDVVETSLPMIRLTKSRNGKTGTATFLFIRPSIFEMDNFSNLSIDGMFLVYEKKTIVSYDIEIFFHEGKPFLLKTIVLLKSPKEWFLFLNFMSAYAKETGLSFDEIPEAKNLKNEN